jgi:hypothetical protein
VTPVPVRLWGRPPCDVHPSLAVPVATGLFARLGVSFSPPPQPEVHARTEENGNEGTRTTDGLWADGPRAMRLRSVAQWWGSTSMTSGGASSYSMEVSGLPGDARVTLNGSALSSYEVVGPADAAARAERALLDEVADRLAAAATRRAHPSVPPAWSDRAAALALNVARHSFTVVVPDVLPGVVAGVPFAVLSTGTLGVPDAGIPEPALRVLGPVPSVRQEERMEWPCALLPVPSSLLRLFGFPPATISARVRRSSSPGEPAGLFGRHALGGEVEEVTVWRAGSWVLREARVYERARLERADVALQCEGGGEWALFLQFTAPPAGKADRPGQVTGVVVGAAGILEGIVENVKALLARPLPTGPPLPEFIHLSSPPPAALPLGPAAVEEAAARMLDELEDGTRWLVLESLPLCRRECLHHDPVEGWRVLSRFAAHDLDFALTREGPPSARSPADARQLVVSLLSRLPRRRPVPIRRSLTHHHFPRSAEGGPEAPVPVPAVATGQGARATARPRWRRALELLAALAVHACVLPLWLVQALVWNAPSSLTRTPADVAADRTFIMAVALVVLAVWVALGVALIVWWRQGRRGLFLSPLVAGGVVAFPCLLPVLIVPAVRQALWPPRPPRAP